MRNSLKYLLFGALCLYVCTVLLFLSGVQQSETLSSNTKLQGYKYEKNPHYILQDERITNKQSVTTFQELTSKKDTFSDRRINSLNANFTPMFGKHFIYSAYVDDRQKIPYIRLIGIGPQGKNKRPTGFFCYFEESIETPGQEFKTELIYYETCESHMQTYSFYIMSCPIPNEVLENYVTLEQSKITIVKPKKNKRPLAKIELPVLNNKAAQATNGGIRFAVCVPPLFDNISVLRFVEFVELSRLLGSEHFTFYAYKLHSDIKSVLKFYEKKGIATVLPWELPLKGNIWYKGQSVAIGDCLFRNMYKYDFVAFNDIDEFIIPHKGKNWEDMLEYIHLNSSTLPDDTAVYRFKSSFFTPFKKKRNFKNFPKEFKLFISQNSALRTEKVSSIRTKMLVNPTKVFEIGIHHLSKPIENTFVTLNVDPETALLHHYRKCDAFYDMTCDSFRKDSTAWKYMNSLISNTKHSLKNIHHLDNRFNISVIKIK